jgi:putative flippase GtrA
VWTQRAISFLDDLERVALALVARLGPWAAPVAPAYFVARAAERHLKAWRPVAIAMAIAIEAVGIASAHATLRAWAWNREKRKSDPSAPAWLGLALVGVYLGVGVLLAVLVEVLPWLVVWAPAAFFLLAGVAYVVLAMMSDQARREVAVSEAREQEKIERQARRQARRSAPSPQPLALPERVPEFDALLAIVCEQSGGAAFGPADVRGWAGVGRTRAYELLGYGQRLGVVKRVAKGSYVYDGRGDESASRRVSE